MPGRLVSFAEKFAPRKSSSVQPGDCGGVGGGDSGGGGVMHTPSSSDILENSTDGAHNHPAYARSQDDLNPSFPSQYANPMPGVGVAENGAAGGVNDGPGDGHQLGRGHPKEFLASNGNRSNGAHLHSKDDLDFLRPRKTRRTSSSFDKDYDPWLSVTRPLVSLPSSQPMDTDGGPGRPGEDFQRLYAVVVPQRRYARHSSSVTQQCSN